MDEHQNINEYFTKDIEQTNNRIKEEGAKENIEEDIYTILENFKIYDEKYIKKENAYIKIVKYAEKQD